MTESLESTAPSDRGSIVLTGFMGTGKTTVGRLLAARLGFTFLDTDHMLEKRHGTIASIFVSKGEDAFRQLERSLAQELSGRSGLVISTGGRLMLDPVNADALSVDNCVFCLVATPEQILRRVLANRGGPVRPLLAGTDPRRRITELLAERKAGYGVFPQVSTENQTPAQIVEKILEIRSKSVGAVRR